MEIVYCIVGYAFAFLFTAGFLLYFCQSVYHLFKN